MTKRVGAVITIIFACTAAMWAQDRIAVLDTVLPSGMDKGVVIPITEKIMEEFVRSKSFVVLDRSFIEKTLSEQEFSTSDLTSSDSQQLATIGGFLKASYIVVSTVQKLGDSFFLSAKMIDVSSGVIVAQSSVNRDGSISVLIGMAGELGQKLVAVSTGQEIAASSSNEPATTKPTQSAPPARTRTTTVAPEPAPKPEPKARPSRFSTISVDFGSGATVANELDTGYNYYTFADYDYDAVPGMSYGASLLLPLGLFYLSGNAGWTTAEYDGSLAFIGSSVFTLGVGFGLDIAVGPVLLYAGFRGTSMSFNLIEEYYSSGVDLDTTYAGIGSGFEAGADLRLGGVALGVRYISDAATL
ncbi:MAG: hypothetical protein JXM71_03830, partial [Spirochaetales bacterium]|nr:hypothetical protein [Spirochaetales bacterium]